MAHGVAIKNENIPKLISYANKKLSEIEFNVDEVEVDYIFTNSSINYNMIFQFGDAIKLYGNGIPQPKFAFELKLTKNSIQTLGKNQDTIKFSVGGIDFIKFKDKSFKSELEKYSDAIIDISMVGRAQINSWNNKKRPQVIVDDYNLKISKIESLF
jgi:single-stranded-DNA-specific exonuclease